MENYLRQFRKLTAGRCYIFVAMFVLLPCILSFAQIGPLRFSSPFHSLNSDSLLLETGPDVPDSSRLVFAGVGFLASDEFGCRKCWLALGNTGGLILFSDSLFKNPLRTEKRSGFSFQRMLPGQELLIYYTCLPGAGNYLAFQLVSEKPVRQILDEILYCSHSWETELRPVNTLGWINWRKVSK